MLQIPEEEVTKNGEKADRPRDDDDDDDRDADDAKASGSNGSKTSSASGPPPSAASVQVTDDDDDDGKGDYVQVSRLGNPLVNEVVIPLGQKDRFNRTTPDRDADELRTVRGRAGAGEADERPVQPGRQGDGPHGHRARAAPGRPGLNQQTGKPVDTLKINLTTPPSATPNRFGVIAGDNAGFPNGRRLADDVVDIELRVVAGAVDRQNVPLGDGVDENDKPFSTDVPLRRGAGFRIRPEAKREHVPIAPNK